MLECKGLKSLWRRVRLRIHKLELVSRQLNEVGAGLGAHTDPIDRLRSGSGSIRLYGDCEAAIVQRVDQGVVKLEERLTSGADDESPIVPIATPRPLDGDREIVGRCEASA